MKRFSRIIWSSVAVLTILVNTGISTRAQEKAKVKQDTLSVPKPIFKLPGLRTDQPAGSDTIRHLENQAFQVGEELVFEIAYGIIKAGKATMSIPDTQWVRGRPCYHVVTTAESNKFISTFYKVRDRVETFIDMEGIFPWKFEKHIREGGFKADQYVDYDQVLHRVIKDEKDSLYVPPFTQGVLSSFYYVRTKMLAIGKPFDVMNYGDGKLYPLRVFVHNKERIKVPAGEFDCIRVEPVLKSSGIFNQTGKLEIWLTDDAYKIPVLMKSKVAIGSVSCRLLSCRTGDGMIQKSE
jgi:hypothetical protein